MNKRYVLLSVVLASGMRAEELKLEQAVQMATRQNPSIANAVIDVARVEDQIGALRTKRLPGASLFVLGSQQLQSFNFTVQRGTLGVYNSIGPIPDKDVHYTTPLRPTGFLLARISQPVSTLYRIRQNIRLLDIGKELAKEQQRLTRQSTIRDVKKLYYTIQQIEASLRVTAETLKLYRELDRLTTEYVEKQTVLRSDQLEVQTRLAKTEQAQLNLQNQLSTLKEQLNALIGRDAMSDFTVSSIADSSDSPADLTAARARALEMRPELRQAQLKIRQAEQDVRAKKAEYIPDIGAEFIAIALLNYSPFLPRATNSVGLSLTWEPFDWGRKRHEIVEKRRTIEQARNTEADARNKIAIDVNDKFRQMQQARMQLRVSTLAQATAAENLRVVEKRYQVEATLTRDVLQAQVALEQTNADHQQALANFWTSRAKYERAIGEDQ